MKSFTLIVICVILFAGCEQASPGNPDPNGRYPVGATDITDQGNDWVTFKWEGQCFLMNQNSLSLGNNFDRVLTKIDCKL